MPATQTIRRLPPLRNAGISQPMTYWELETQGAAPLITMDTSGGDETMSPPAAGLNQSTGQTNQNQEITYIKTSSDANTFTLSGDNLPLGPYTLTAPGQALKIKSNGTNWYKSA